MNRIFPRYTVSKLGIKVHFSSFETAEYYLENASLTGLQIYGKSKIITQDFNLISVILSEKERFDVHAYQVWTEDQVELSPFSKDPLKKFITGPCFRSGMRLKFLDAKNYQKWLKFITALHNVQNKKLVLKD